MERGDIYLVCLDTAAGHEQMGTRPVLVISSLTFNLCISLLIAKEI